MLPSGAATHIVPARRAWTRLPENDPKRGDMRDAFLRGKWAGRRLSCASHWGLDEGPPGVFRPGLGMASSYPSPIRGSSVGDARQVMGVCFPGRRLEAVEPGAIRQLWDPMTVAHSAG